MKTTKITIALLIAFLFFSSSHLLAQAETDVIAELGNFPQFFICLLAGVLLAIGFQVLLTTLSVATGISFIGNLEEKNKDKESDYNTESDYNKEHNSSSTLVKISSAAGIWTIVTVSLALFFASLLAVKLSLIESDTLGITLGLVIWAAFFTLMMYLEIKSVSSLLGGLFKTAIHGLRSSFDMARGIFEKSPEHKMADMAKTTVDSIRNEIAKSMNGNDMAKKMDEYINKLKPQQLDHKKIKKDIADIINEIELEEQTSMEDSGVKKKIFVQIASRQPNLTRHDVQKISKVFDEAKGVATSEGSRADKVLRAMDKFTPGTEEDTRQYRSKLEAYLRNTGKEELNPDRIKQDLEQMLNEPSRSKEIALNRFNQMDKNTLVSVLSQRKDISEEQANKIAGYAEDALHYVKEKILGSPSTSTSGAYSMSPYTRDYGAVEEHRQNSNSGGMNKFETKISNYLNGLQRPEFNYDRLKRDFEEIFHDPKSTVPILKERLDQYDKNSLITLLSSSDHITREEAERMVNKIEEAKTNALKKAEELQMQVKMKVEQAKEFALHEAENMRKATAAAAWWLFATAVLSGAASALGGALALG